MLVIAAAHRPSGVLAPRTIASLAVSVLNRAGLTNHAAARRDLG